jgi:hypothetical protein
MRMTIPRSMRRALKILVLTRLDEAVGIHDTESAALAAAGA